MEIKNFIKIYDDVLPIEVISNIIKYANSLKFNEATIVGKQQTGKELNLNIRKTYTYPLTNLSNMMSDVHWANLLRSTFKAFIDKYVSDLGIHNIQLKELDYPQVLKYTAGGFYDWHIDDAVIFPRTLSVILLLNNENILYLIQFYYFLCFVLKYILLKYISFLRFSKYLHFLL
jgi:hypothetical protein